VPMTTPEPADQTLVAAHDTAQAAPVYEQVAANTRNAYKTYAAEQKKMNEERLILDFLPLVHKIVQNIAGFVNNSGLSYDDLVSAGTMGLVKAARDFDSSHDATFKTYAYIRIRGAVIDELRSWTFTPTNVAKNIEQVDVVIRQSIEQTGSAPSDEELAARLDLPIDKLYRLFEQARSQHFLSIHSLTDSGPALSDCLAGSSEDPSSHIEKTELVELLTAAIQALPKSQRHVIVLYYQRDMTMKEIAAVLDVTESRVSQLHSGALVRLSAHLRHLKDER
jgi:RNA polymerase sigma factor for flagellar operon FliA